MASNFTATTDPTASNGTPTYSVGDFWLNTSAKKMFQARDVTSGSARWIELNSVVNVRDFGALGDGSTDDTAAIQAAIDSLPQSQGLGNPDTQNGGLVFFPAGTYKTTAALKQYGNVCLCGTQRNASMIVATLSSNTDAAIKLTEVLSTLPYAEGASVRHLGIKTNQGFGISAPGVEVIGFIAEDLLFSTGNFSVAFAGDNAAYCQNSVFRNWLCKEVGSGVLQIDGNVHLVEQIDVEGGVRTSEQGGFTTPSTGMFELRGNDITVRQCIVEVNATGYTYPVAFYVGQANHEGPSASPSGLVTLEGNWVENTNAGCHFEDVERLYIDSTGGSDTQPLYFRNCRDVQIKEFAVGYQESGLQNAITISDTGSFGLVTDISIDEVVSEFPAGSLDHPQIRVRQFVVYGSSTPQKNDGLHAPRTANVLVNGDFEQGMNGWSIVSTGGVSDATVEVIDDPDGYGRCLHVSLPTAVPGSGTYFIIGGTVNVPSNLSGAPATFGAFLKVVPASGSFMECWLNTATRSAVGLVTTRLASATSGTSFYIEGSGDLYIRQAHVVLGTRYNFTPDRAVSRTFLDGRTEDSGTATPSGGTWKAGSIRWNSSPTAGGNAGWVCVTAGNPGTWKTFGAIAS